MIAFWILLGIWLAGPVCCWIYLLVLLPRDVRYVRKEAWYCAQFKLISKKSRYARAWKRWSGIGLWGFMITNDASPMERKHELTHVRQWLILGGYFFPVYIFDCIRIWVFCRNQHAYYDNFLERMARASAGQTVDIARKHWMDGKDDRWPWW